MLYFNIEEYLEARKEVKDRSQAEGKTKLNLNQGIIFHTTRLHENVILYKSINFLGL